MQNKSEILSYLNNKKFILWCLTKEENLNSYWEEYIRIHPEKESIIETAKEELNSIAFKQSKLTEAEQDSIEVKIERSLQVRRQKRIRLSFVKYAAACILLLCIGSMVLLNTNHKSSLDTLAYIDTQLDSTQTEIELIMKNEKPVIVSNNSTIKLDSSKISIKTKTSTNTLSMNSPEKDKEVVALHVLKVPKGRQSSLVLSDGSKIWVNSGTVVQFPEVFEKNKRVIYVDGEVYLEVAHNAESPFHVVTRKLDIEVLGTSFNVCSYDDEVTESIVLKEGSVCVKNHAGLKQLIKPNEKLTFANDSYKISVVDVNDYLSWKEGYLQFKQKPLKEVFKRLERYYRCKMNCNEDIMNMKCTGKLVLFEDSKVVLENLKISLGISYEINDDEILIYK